jgi:hypothetical protein
MFLMSFGEGGGFGVYQLVEDVLRHFCKDLVVPQKEVDICTAVYSLLERRNRGELSDS